MMGSVLVEERTSISQNFSGRIQSRVFALCNFPPFSISIDEDKIEHPDFFRPLFRYFLPHSLTRRMILRGLTFDETKSAELPKTIPGLVVPQLGAQGCHWVLATSPVKRKQRDSCI